MIRGLYLGWVLVLGACGFQVGGETSIDALVDQLDAPPPAPWLPGFTARKPIELMGAPTELVGFVASIAEDTDPDLVAATTVAFTAGDGVTVLPVELVAFDPATGKLEASVRVTLAPSTKTRIYLYYGTAPALMTTGPWGTQFEGVWHMGSAGAMNEIVRDSTKLHDATATASDIPTTVPGILGEARLFDGSNDSFAIVDPPDGSLDFGTESFTVGLWVKVDQSAGAFDMPLFKGGLTAGAAGYDIELGTGGWIAGFADNTATQITPAFGLEVNLLHQWHYLVAQCDRGATMVRAFLDGVQTEALPFPRGSVDSGYYVRFGDPTYRFRGQLDEIHIVRGALSADWIATEYANLAKRSAFQSILPSELK